MRNPSRLLPMLALACLAASCASSSKFARQSDEALREGDVRKAYDRALRAIQMDPMNAQAHDAYQAASDRVATDLRTKVEHMVAVDTLRAADLALEEQDFVHEVASHDVAVTPDPTYAAIAKTVRRAAARPYFAQGRSAYAAHLPKEAWRQLHAGLRYDPDDAGAQKLLDAAWQKAVTHVAVLPFADGIHVAGLSEDAGQRTSETIAKQAGDAMTFTQVADWGLVSQNAPLAAARDLSDDDAAAIGRRLGVDRVVSAHIAGLRSDNDLQYWATPVFRRVEAKDSEGHTIVSWQEKTMHCIIRQKNVTVRWNFSVLDTRHGDALAHRDIETQTAARVVWSDFVPEGDCSAYQLLPPDLRGSDPDRARLVDQAWHDHLGSWTLSALLQVARDNRFRIRYSTQYRGEFYSDTRNHPVWMGELPGEGEMAFVAMSDAWKPVLETLKDLDQRDDATVSHPPLAGDEDR